MKKILFFILTQIICGAIEVGTLFIARFSIYIWILLVAIPILAFYLAYKNQTSRGTFIISIVIIGVIVTAIWIYSALSILTAFHLYGSAMEDSIARGIVLYIFVPILSLWSTASWAFLELWPFNREKFVR